MSEDLRNEVGSLLELADRVEAATDTDRQLGADVEIALRGFPERAYQQQCGLRAKESPLPDRREWAASWFGPGPTASLDAAKSLKHPGDLWCVGSMEDGPFARVVPALPGGAFGEEVFATGATTALALTAALLRAERLRALATPASTPERERGK
jgi:hypothetical protein